MREVRLNFNDRRYYHSSKQERDIDPQLMCAFVRKRKHCRDAQHNKRAETDLKLEMRYRKPKHDRPCRAREKIKYNLF